MATINSTNENPLHERRVREGHGVRVWRDAFVNKHRYEGKSRCVMAIAP